MAVCEICWEKAGAVARETGLSQSEEYMNLLAKKRDVHELEAENTILRDALEKWCLWEVELLNNRSAWDDGLPKMTQELYDKYLSLQLIRNEALEETE